jgi:hypothetical protein
VQLLAQGLQGVLAAAAAAGGTSSSSGAAVVEVQGGDKRNAIPREAWAVVLVSGGQEGFVHVPFVCALTMFAALRTCMTMGVLKGSWVLCRRTSASLGVAPATIPLLLLRLTPSPSPFLLCRACAVDR